MTTAVIVHRQRTACAAAAWLLRRELLKTHDTVLVYADEGRLINPQGGAAYYFIGTLPTLKTLMREYTQAVSITYIAKCAIDILQRFEDHFKFLPKFQIATHHQNGIIDIVLSHLNLTDARVPELLLWLAHRYRGSGDTGNRMTTNLYAALSSTDDLVDRLDEYCHPDRYQETFATLMECGKALEHHRLKNASKIIDDHTFHMLLGKLDGMTLPVTLTPRHQSMEIAYHLAKRDGFGITAYDKPVEKVRSFLLVKDEGYPLDIYAIARNYNGRGNAVRCRFDLPLFSAVQLME